MEKELGQTDTPSTSYERFMDFREHSGIRLPKAREEVGSQPICGWGLPKAKEEVGNQPILGWGLPKAWVAMEDGVD